MFMEVGDDLFFSIQRQRVTEDNPIKISNNNEWRSFYNQFFLDCSS